MKKLIRGLLGALAFCLGFVLGITYWIFRFAIPAFVFYLIMAFILQESNYKLWTSTERMIYVILTAISIYGIYLYDPQKQQDYF